MTNDRAMSRSNGKPLGFNLRIFSDISCFLEFIFEAILTIHG